MIHPRKPDTRLEDSLVPVIETDNLVKHYGRIEALKGVSLTVEKGEIFGLLGQNGAGKTTLIKILLGITKLTDGERPLLGEPAGTAAVRRRVGYLPEDHRFPDYHTGSSLLDFYGALLGVPRSERRKRIPRDARAGRPQGPDALQDPHLLQGHEAAPRHRPGDVARPGGHLSRRADRRRRPGRPPRNPRRSCSSSRSEGKTIFLNSHLLGEVELICDRVAILQTGRDDPRRRHRHADAAARACSSSAWPPARASRTRKSASMGYEVTPQRRPVGGGPDGRPEHRPGGRPAARRAA